MRRKNTNLIPAGAQDLTGSVNFPAVELLHAAIFSAQLVYTGTLAGTFKLQGSNDVGAIDQNSGTPSTGVSHWTDIASSSVSVAAAGSTMYNIADCAYDWVRVVWTVTSGAGSLTVARLVTKGF